MKDDPMGTNCPGKKLTNNVINIPYFHANFSILTTKLNY